MSQVVNANATIQAPAHQQSQQVAPGNHTQGGDPIMEKRMIELMKREKELQTRQASMKNAVSLDDLKARAKSDRNAVLRELGLEDLVQEDPNDPHVSLRREVEALKQEREAELAKAREAEEIRNLRAQLDEKADDYEYLRALGLESHLHSLMKNRSQEGETPDVYSFASELENSLIADIEKLSASKRFSSKYRSPEPAKHPLDSSRTITSSDRGSSDTPAERPLSRQELIEQAAKLLRHNTPQS